MHVDAGVVNVRYVLTFLDPAGHDGSLIVNMSAFIDSTYCTRYVITS